MTVVSPSTYLAVNIRGDVAKADVDYARKRGGQKRGGKASQVSLDEAIAARIPLYEDLIAVHEALNRLSEIDARKAQIVELRFFSGLTEEETAAVLNISPETVRRDWRFAKAWLMDQLQPAR